jgi:hypothetical protein
MQSDPWPAGRRGYGHLQRAGGAAGQASGSGGHVAHLEAVGHWSGGGELAGGEVQRQLVAAAAAARWTMAWGRNAGKQATA